MKEVTGRVGQVAIVLLACAALSHGAAAQETRPRVASTMEYVAGERVLGPIVRGAPYSGEASTTVSQMLADGTRIERTTTMRVFRDGEGRTRREQTVLGLGALSPAADAPTIVTIEDPVANVTYVLDPATRQARRGLPSAGMRWVGGATTELRVSGAMVVSAMPASGVMVYTADAGVPGAPPPPPPPPTPGSQPRYTQGAPPPPPPPPAPSGESLGVKQIEGLEATGVRTKMTIEAGRIGNDRPIDVIDERWDSPALKVLVHSRHSDPRTGVVEYRLTNVSRAEPPHDLFVVPADYAIVDARENRER